MIEFNKFIEDQRKLLENMPSSDVAPDDYILVLEKDKKKLEKLLVENSKYTNGKYKFVYLYTKNRINMPAVESYSLYLYEMAIDETQGWIKISDNLDEAAITAGPIYSLILDPGIYLVYNTYPIRVTRR